MKKLFCSAVWAVAIGLAEQLLASPLYEPFDDAPGVPLMGQMAPGAPAWMAAGSGAEQPTIVAGNLTAPGMSTPRGQMLRLRPGAGPSARLPFDGAVSNAAMFFSFAMKIPNASGLGTDGEFFAGFTPSGVAQANAPTNGFTRVFLRSAPGGYQVGLAKSTSLVGDIVWHSTTFTSNDTVLIAGSYTFTAGPGNDTARLWVNPSAAAFGVSDAPAPTLTATTGPDVNQLASIVLFQKPAPILPALLQLDELRLGATWTSVTPPAASNQPPSISDIANLTVEENVASPISFTVSDAESAAGSLDVTGSSSNPSLVPDANIVFSGSGSNRTVTVTPTAGQSGNATITITVSDGGSNASDTFILTVTPASSVSSAQVLELTLQSATSLDGNWRDVPLAPYQVRDGRLYLVDRGEHDFFRLKVGRPAGPNRFCAIWPITPIGSPSPTRVCAPSMRATARSALLTAITPRAAASKPWNCPG